MAINSINITKQATSYVQSMYQTAKSSVSKAAETVKQTASTVVKSQAKGFVETAKIWGNGINDAVQKNFGLPGVQSNASGGFIYAAVAKGGVQAALKGAGTTALAKTGYDTVVNVAKGYYNYITGSK
ncbi:hypothetical protein [Paenibacillus wynnii]|uniref:Uncharacterized protein n=1 Tax=Paenibacillus wynnii TaxID=268407 RepID=A0A098MAV9_9BACL|nr:hypothetical protein [Paenibacillus wynnii]KGE19680.1 hypothetical protein PWYN_10240 [Paenibacillus wynnii]